ncbi:MAG TPA: TMEM175 family protein [Ginsengibacter sp.]
MSERLEPFCDGVFAIAITLLILEIKVPLKESIYPSSDLRHALETHWPSWFAFLLSFISLFIGSFIPPLVLPQWH